MSLLTKIFLTICTVLLLTGCGTEHSMNASTPTDTAAKPKLASCPQVPAGAIVKTADGYRYVLRVGTTERMYSQADADRLQPTSGELMTGSDGMDMSGSTQMSSDMPMAKAMEGGNHLEVGICRTQDNSVVSNPHPTIMIQASDGTDKKIDAVAMTGVDGNPADLHFGNNVQLTPGKGYTVTVGMNGTEVTFTDVKAPPNKQG